MSQVDGFFFLKKIENHFRLVVQVRLENQAVAQVIKLAIIL